MKIPLLFNKLSSSVLIPAAEVGRGGRESRGRERREGCPLLTEMPSFQELLLTRTEGQSDVCSRWNGG